MKWVQVRDGSYKYVNDNDPRPSVELHKRQIGDTYVKFTPSWKKYEQNYWTPDPERTSDNKTTDKFLAERDHETKTDPKARRWEDSRKKEWARNKPAWRKQMATKGLI